MITNCLILLQVNYIIYCWGQGLDGVSWLSLKFEKWRQIHQNPKISKFLTWKEPHFSTKFHTTLKRKCPHPTKPPHQKSLHYFMRHQRETLPVHRSTTKHEQFRHPTKLMSVQNTLNWIFTWNNSVVKLSLRHLKAWIIVKSVYFFCFIKKFI